MSSQAVGVGCRQDRIGDTGSLAMDLAACWCAFHLICFPDFLGSMTATRRASSAQVRAVTDPNLPDSQADDLSGSRAASSASPNGDRKPQGLNCSGIVPYQNKRTVPPLSILPTTGFEPGVTVLFSHSCAPVIPPGLDVPA